MKKCPYCSEEIQDAAVKCRYCGEWFTTKPAIDDAYECLPQNSKESIQKNSQLHEAPIAEPSEDCTITLEGESYNLLKEAECEAFCLGCRSVDATKKLYYCRKVDKCYHKECLIKEGGIPLALAEGKSSPQQSVTNILKREKEDNKHTTKCPSCGYERTEGDDRFFSNEVCPYCRILYKEHVDEKASLSSQRSIFTVVNTVEPSPESTPQQTTVATPLIEKPKQKIITYAGFWKRVLASLIDSFITTFGTLSILLIFILMFTGGTYDYAAIAIWYILMIVAVWLYYALMEVSSKQGTLGKMALGIKVTDLNGNKISFGRATGRYFGKIISAFILCVGFIMVAFTQRKQGLHDIIAGCLVVNCDLETANFKKKIRNADVTQSKTNLDKSVDCYASEPKGMGIVDVRDISYSDSIPKAEKKSLDKSLTSDEAFYEKAFYELESKDREIGLWAKVFAAAQGDESLARANYLKLRAEQLSKEYEQNLTRKRERQIEMMRQQDALALEKRILEQKRQEFELRLKEYKKIDGQTGDAFCIVCKKVSPINGMFHHKPTDTYYHMNCLPKNEQSPKYDIAEIQRLSDKYNDFKDRIISEVKKTLKTNEEIQILESQSRLPYSKLIELGSPGQLTDKGLAVFKLLIKEIDKTLR